jgi:hypothetical protein
MKKFLILILTLGILGLPCTSFADDPYADDQDPTGLAAPSGAIDEDDFVLIADPTHTKKVVKAPISTVMATSNAATASALAANGANCAAGSYPLGVDASGAAESCTDATTEIDSAIATHLSVSASEGAEGHIELATNAETVTGTDTARAVTPDGLTDKMAAPGEIGGTTPAAGNFTTLATTGTSTFGSAGGAGTLNIGSAAADDTEPTLVLRGDADEDAGDDVQENLTLTLAPAADPTDATWGWTSTQGAGYTFDKKVYANGGVLSLTPMTDAAADFAANFTGAYLYGGTFVCDTTGTIQLPEMAAGMNFTIITKGDIEVVIDTNAADGYLMDGTTNAEGKNLTNLSTSGDIAVIQYYDADDWLITTNGWTPEA